MSFRRRYCTTTGKRRFKTRQQALQAIRLSQQDGAGNPRGFVCDRCHQWHLHRPDWTEYRCPHCAGWHLTSNKPLCSEARTA